MTCGNLAFVICFIIMAEAEIHVIAYLVSGAGKAGLDAETCSITNQRSLAARSLRVDELGLQPLLARSWGGPRRYSVKLRLMITMLPTAGLQQSAFRWAGSIAGPFERGCWAEAACISETFFWVSCFSE